jgi:Protein related to penicillin acylase
VRSEVWRARLACRSSLSLTQKWKVLQPAWETKIPDGLDPCTIPEGVLNIYDLATRSVDFKKIQKSMDTYDLSSNDNPVFQEHLGSNNWVVSGNRTKSGRPILADDPHRSHAVPSLRYIAHLVGPDINVIGAGEPALPGISIGHNENIAFGLTIFPIDQEDLYVYRRKGNGYEYKGKETAFKRIEEQIKVKEKNPVKRILEFTSHGPVIAKNGTHAFAVGAAWLLPGMAPYFGSIEYMRAKDLRTFIGALNRWGAPTENQVYADMKAI